MSISAVKVNIITRKKLLLKLEGDFFFGDTQRRVSGDWSCFYKENKIYLENNKEIILIDDTIVLYPLFTNDCGFVITDNTEEKNFFRGNIILKEKDGEIQLINEVNLEFLVRSILCHSFPNNTHLEFLKVMALIVRTNALIYYRDIDEIIEEENSNETDYLNIDPNILHSYYKGLSQKSNILTHDAVSLTEGMVLTKNDNLFKCDQTICCGGVYKVSSILDDDQNEIVIQDNGLGELVDLTDNEVFKKNVLSEQKDFCNFTDRKLLKQLLIRNVVFREENYRWKKVFVLNEIIKALSIKNILDADVLSVEVTSRSVKGEVLELKILKSDGSDLRFGYKDILLLKKELELPSIAFAITSHIDYVKGIELYSFNGMGRGIGGGICQMGALMMAAQKRNSDQIISKYYPGVVLEKYY